MRPIDIARKLKISTTTLRSYEELGLLPPVVRYASGYRNYTDEHIAYFVCIREMLPGFTLVRIAQMLKEVMATRIEAALWLANKAQAELRQEKNISEKIMLHLIQKNEISVGTEAELFTINEVSLETGVPASTIRYWDKVGLIAVERATENNYRLFTAKHIRQILIIYALKFSLESIDHKYSVDKVKEELKGFDYNDKNRIITLASDIERHLAIINRAQIKAIAALYQLCLQVEANQFDTLI